MDNLNLDSESVDRESDEEVRKIEKIKEEGLHDIVKYFDRIHDNLFNYNNLLIGGFFALGQFQENISRWTILIPIFNLWFLIYIDYRMMENSRFSASIMDQTRDSIKKQGKSVKRITLISLLLIITTIVVTISFLYYLIIHH